MTAAITEIDLDSFEGKIHAIDKAIMDLLDEIQEAKLECLLPYLGDVHEHRNLR